MGKWLSFLMSTKPIPAMLYVIYVLYVKYVLYVIYVLVVIYVLHAIYVFKDVIYGICKGVGGWRRRLIFRSSGGPGEPCKD